MITEFRKEYHWLSNFAEVTVILDNIECPSVEHAYISAKSDDPHWKKMCADKKYKAGDLKKDSKYLPPLYNWNKIKVHVMANLLQQKFNQEPFKSLLLTTGDMHIQEGNLWNDTFWGVCLKTNSGENMLGKLIMKIR